MPAHLEFNTRKASSAELRVLQALSPDSIPRNLLFRTAFVAAIAGAYFAKSGGLFGSLFGFFFPLAVAAGFVISENRARNKMSDQRSADHKRGVVEVLTITEASPLLVYSKHSSVEPAFAFELPNRQILMLVGPWLKSPQCFDGPGAQVPRGDGKPYANGLVPPYAFPVDAFEVVRFPSSGVVAQIWLQGDYVAPQPLGGAVSLESLSGFQSLLLETTPSDLSAALESRMTMSDSVATTQRTN